MYFVYILFSKKLQKYYIGQTNNIKNRLQQHNSGESNYTSRGIPWEFKWYTMKNTRSEAIILERKLKNLSQQRLLLFMEKYNHDAGGLDDFDVSRC